MEKLETLKIGGVQRGGKKIEKMCFVSWKACFFFLAIFSLLLFIYTSKMISKA
jgi:hypothetical protein